MKFPKNTVIIEVTSIDFTGKDIIEIKELDDFVYLLGNGGIFKLKNTYYIISDTVAYIYKK